MREVEQVVTKTEVVKIYVANDGTEFTKKFDCENYENKISLEHKWSDYISNKIKIWKDYCDDGGVFQSQECVYISSDEDFSTFMRYLRNYKHFGVRRLSRYMNSDFSIKNEYKHLIGNWITYNYDFSSDYECFSMEELSYYYSDIQLIINAYEKSAESIKQIMEGSK